MTYSPKEWELVDYGFTGTTVDLSANPVIFNNLLGDTYDYRFYIFFYGDGVGTSQILYQPNSDTSSTNYRRYDMNGNLTNAVADASDSSIAYGPATYNSSQRNMAIVEVTGSSGNERTITSFDCEDASTPKNYIVSKILYWKNTSNELTSFQLNGVNTNAINVDAFCFRRPKAGVYQANDWKIVDRVELSSQNLNTNPVDFFVQGDTEEYRFEFDIESASDQGATIAINDDTTASNYATQYFNNNGGTLGASAVAQLPFLLLGSGSSGNCKNNVTIKADTGQYRPILMSEGAVTSATYVEQLEGAWWWKNTSNAINKFTITGSNSVNSTGTITLYKRTKFKSSINSHEQLIEEYTISGDFSGGYTFKNLQGNQDALYKLVISGSADSVNNSLTKQLNGDAGSNYVQQQLYCYGTTTEAYTDTFTSLWIDNVHTTNTLLDVTYIFPKTGKYRPVISRIAFLDTFFAFSGDWWKNTADDIYSLTVKASTTDTMEGKIQLYKIQDVRL